MYAWEQIQQTIEFIENHINEKISIDELASIAALSPFYYQRLFSRLVKKPVAEYIRLRRMSRSMELLLQNDCRILDIAMEVGFSTHEHFTRTFKATFGISPDEYRKKPQILNHMTKPELKLKYTSADEGVPLVTDGVVIEVNRRLLNEAIQFVGLDKKMPVQFTDSLGVESGVDPLAVLWDDFHYKKTSELLLDDDVSEIGVSLQSDDTGYFLYFVGANAGTTKVCDGYKSWKLPQGEYIVCTFEAENFEMLVTDALYKAQRYLFESWLPSHRLQTEAFCAERYESYTPKTSSMELWVKLIT